MSGTVAVVPNGTANGHIDLSSANGNGNAHGSSMKFTSGLILPPPEVKSIIDRTANFVAKSANPPQFEDKIRENQRQDPKFSFLNPADPYHAYYRNRMDKVIKGELEEDVVMKEGGGGAGKDGDGEGAGGGGEGGGEGEGKKVEEDVGVEPPSPEFILELPNISAIDLDIMKLTALFTARRGRSFLQALTAKESRNYQFDFLKPTHSLFPVFNQLIEQYTKVLLPPPAKLEELKKRARSGAKWEMLENARQYAKWEQKKRDQERKREDDREAERLAFAEIDWHDYAIVQTIEFTAADAASELPPPMSVQEVENMTLAQKRHAAMIMETTAEEVEAHRARQAEAEQNVANGVGGAGAEDGDAMMESDEEEDAEAVELKERKRRDEEERNREMERAKAIQASSLGAGGQMKIRTDYVAKVGQKNKVALTTCSICGQQIPVNELDEHMRIELLDPRWKSQRDALEARKAQASELQRGANVVSSLKNLARTRVDIFGGEDEEERRKREEEEENQKRKEREKVIWDGHTASKSTTMDKYATNSNIDEQIAAIHRAKLGLGPQEGAIGPGIGPAAPPPLTGLPAPSPLPAMSMSMASSLPSKPISTDPTQSSGTPTNTTTTTTTFPPASLPNPNTPNPVSNPAYSAATISSGPQPPSMYPPQPAPVMLPPLHYQGLDAAQPFGYQPPPIRPVTGYAPGPAPGTPGQGTVGGPQPAIIGGGTAGMMGPGAQGGASVVGMVRSADEMMEGGGGGGVGEDEGPAAKRQKVAKLPGGQLYPEQDWIGMHPNPITIQVQIPADKPDLGLDGSLVTIPDLSLDLLVSTLRDRIMKATNIAVGYSHIRLAHEGKMMSNQASVASYNLEEEDLVVLSVREAKKKK